MATRKTVVVVGSLSVDFVMRVPRRPAKGETISGFDFNTFVGGKGNNQALAAARAGATVHMVGRVGEDDYGDRLEKTLRESNVSTEFLFRDNEAGTGIANIYVDPEGDNSIVIVPQSNGKLSPLDVGAAQSLFAEAAVVMLQLEVPYETVSAAAKAARAAGAIVVLNPAPAPPTGDLPPALLQNVDILVPNQTEAELLTGVAVTDTTSARKACRAIKSLGVKQVILTMGASGAIIFDDCNNITEVPAFKVEAVDTTAAGDAFCGALAASLADNKSLNEAVLLGCAAGSLACTKPGAEPSLPTRAEIDQILSRA